MENLLKKYALLAVKTGVNIKKDQYLVINSPIECAFFARQIAEEAYKLGAKQVIIHWNDEKFARINYTYASIETLEDIPNWIVDSYLSYAKKGAAFLSISASDPENLKGIDANKISASLKARQIALREYSDLLMSNKCPWSIVSIPTTAWAKKVFSNVSEEEAVSKLWEQIFKIVRIDKEDPDKAWDEHLANLDEKMNYLNEKNFKLLHYTNSLGTDLKIELPKDHLWCGGADKMSDGRSFVANMPTEEVFTLPLKTGINGKVVSSMPLNYSGNLINNFSLTFKDGRIVDFEAKEGYETLKHLIETDEGSHYLGEVALVPYDSPISNSGVIFFNTLYDENASCHLAIGKAYPFCLKDSDGLSKEDLIKKGANDSLAHVDFMVGTKDLDIVGITNAGEKIQIFKNGNWAF
ncbi:aminopeptidase [Clostridium sp. YIM B02551]|uniref:aminopeptidase n=1 Tax=Clostridium sp. YIM B02551 TaxID=2910679 RepID=UPI001EEBF43C|nr:aminopeptidase [Clostridium sp. YIM B02551]